MENRVRIVGAAATLAVVIAASATAGAAQTDLLHGSLATADGPLGHGLISKEAPGTNAGLTPRLAALANGLADESKAEQADELSLATRGPGSLQRDGDRYVVTARADVVTAQLIDDLRAAGAQVVSNNAEYGTVDLSVLPADLLAVARVPGVESVYEAVTPIVGRVALRGSATGEPAASETNAITCQGSRTSEADSQMQALAARQTYNVDGTGQKVGIISDSFDAGQNSATRAAQDIASGDLPGPGNPCGLTTPVQVLAEGASTDIDEGRGMAQLVHDVAPGAQIAFATRGASAESMADAVRALKNSGSSVIVDDITFFNEPFFQQGPIDAAVNEVVAAGVPYYSSAANSNIMVGGQNVGSYETNAFRPMSCAPFAGTNCLDFSGGGDNTFGLALKGGSRLQINFQWAEPRNGVTTDLDIYAYDITAGGVLAGASENDNAQTQLPWEIMNVQNTDGATHVYYLFVTRFAGTAAPRLKFILGRPQLEDAEYKTSSGPNTIGPTIFGHNGGTNTVSTAAIPYDNPNAPEGFSSRGPLAYYFGPVSGTTPAAPLAAPQILNKPDLAATDNTQTTFFIDNSSGVYRFSGTSAAAPHAAAVAALQKSANPTLSAADVVNAQTATASPVGAFGHDAVGAGLVNAVAAIGQHPPLVPDTTITKEPKNKIFKKRTKYKFESSIPGSSFICQIDNADPVECGSPVRVVHISYGKHRFRVSAVFNGQVDPSPDKDKFKRKRKSGRQL